MRSPRRVALLIPVPVVVALVLAAATGAFDAARSPPRPELSQAARTPSRPAIAPLRTSLPARLSLAELAGQRIIYAYSGLAPPSSLLARIRAGEAAGVIFFGPNISSPAQLKSVVRELQQANASSPLRAHPLLMLVDQEGGLIRRLPGAPLLSEKQIGQSPAGAALAARAGSGAARNLRAIGLNVNLAPVLDVFRTQGNFIDQYQRSYGSNPADVARLAGAFIASQQGIGVAATAKHFPGLGAASASQNTDGGPVTIDLSLNRLRSTDEAPYATAIAAGVKLVMVSWATYPALDPKLPAGVSPTVIQSELRTRLGFHGVTITDGLGAGSLVRFGGFGQRGVLAAGAGADLLICSTQYVNDNSPTHGIAALDALTAALARHHLSPAAAERAAARVLQLRSNP